MPFVLYDADILKNWHTYKPSIDPPNLITKPSIYKLPSSMNFNHWVTADILLLTACFVFWKPINGADDGKQFSSQSVTVVGRVFCDTCFHRKLTTSSHFIPGASVAVGCNIKRDGVKSKAEGKTDERGFYRIKIPVRFRYEKDIEKCSVELVRSSIIWCSVPFIRNRSRLVIKSKIKDGYLYRADPLSFRPPRLPAFCKAKPQDGFTSSELDFSFPFPFPFPPISLPYPPIPPIGFPLPPFWDLPPIPFWPPLPGVTVPPPPDPIGSGGSPPPPPPLPNLNPPTPTFPPPPPPPPAAVASPPSFPSPP